MPFPPPEKKSARAVPPPLVLRVFAQPPPSFLAAIRAAQGDPRRAGGRMMKGKGGRSKARARLATRRARRIAIARAGGRALTNARGEME